MQTRVRVTIEANTYDPEVEKRLYNAVEDEDLALILDLLEYCSDASVFLDIKEMGKDITKMEH